MTVRRLALLTTLLVSLPALAQGTAKAYALKKDASTLTYRLNHPAHKVVGTAKPIAGKANLKADGTLQVMVVANVKDFDSENQNRDIHMQEVTEVAKYPTVEFKGAATGVTVPTTFPTKVPVTLKGQLDFHGVKQKVEVPVTVLFKSATEVTTDGSFTVSLESYKIERPSLLMVKVDDELVLEPKLVFEVESK
ncbi:YceI family protein [Myxococcus sp. CA056]|uniref:YceI family protein n=1 Tax=unclassified Myxococcus TaxID=2648731 RepID=UPI00157B2586|nr:MULTISPECIES: YceI family protein [unclassified Myxococcus]NTX17658.1 YceI family protein [Myxococcus sp. CA056]NTX40780.1 YceI family protein [Myxococcus sp. CA033]NTX54877.1 YceI family protein [Myxococcus sp. CA039A]